MRTMIKPVKPTEPNYKDYPKTPGLMYDKNGKPSDSLFVQALKKYDADQKQYEIDIVLYEQIKFIEDIQRSTLKLALKKYNVTKK